MVTDIFKVSDDNTSFTTSVPFKESSTSVYINDTPLDTIDYMEANSNEIIINSILNEDDFVIIKYESINNFPVVSHSSKSISLFKTFGSDAKLKINQKYSLSLKIKGKDVQTYFISKCSPYLSTVKKIKEDIGTLDENISDETINHFIYENSKELAEKLRQNFTSAVQYTETEVIINNSIINLSISNSGTFLPDKATAPFLKQWVRYKTDIDVANNIFLSFNKNESTESKRIGSVTIEKKYKIPQIVQMIKQFKENFIAFDSILNGNSGTSAAFTRAGTSNPYPYTGRGSF